MRVTRCLELLGWGFYHHNLSLIRLYRGMKQGKHVFTTYLLYEIQYSTYKNITLSHSSFPTSTTFAVDTREKGENVYLETVTSLGHDNVSTMLMNSDTVRTHISGPQSSTVKWTWFIVQVFCPSTVSLRPWLSSTFSQPLDSVSMFVEWVFIFFSPFKLFCVKSSFFKVKYLYIYFVSKRLPKKPFKYEKWRSYKSKTIQIQIGDLKNVWWIMMQERDWLFWATSCFKFLFLLFWKWGQEC